MSHAEMEEIRNTIENEGFDYAFTGYSNFDEVKDDKFHELRQAYVAAADALKDYLGLEG